MKEKFKVKTYHRIMAAVMIIAVIFVNLIVAALSEKLPLQADLTGEEIFGISEETIKVLKSVDRDIDVYYFVAKGNEDPYVKQAIDMYKGYSGRINFKQVDPARDPAFVKSLGVDVSDNSVIVKSGDRMKIIDASVLYDTTFQQQGIVAFALEVKLTAAIEYVMKESDVNVRFTSGHEEMGEALFTDILTTENATVSTIDLKVADIPEDTAVLYIIGPKRDFSADEISKIQTYVNGGGALNVSLDYGNTLPLFEQFMKEYYGVTFENNIIAETDTSKIVTNNPLYLFPEPLAHDVTNDIIAKKIGVLWPNARGIKIEEKAGVESQVLLKTSDSAIAQEGEAVTEKQSFNLAAAVTAYGSSGKKAKIIVAGTSFYCANMFLQEANVANADFVRNSYNYLYGGEISTLSITPKNVGVNYLKLSLSEIILYAIVVGVIPPVLILGAGVFVWFKRRRL